MTDRLWLDCETRSSVPIKLGTVKYASDVQVIITTWTINNFDVVTDDLLQGEPNGDLIYYAKYADEIWAHEAKFDRTMLGRTKWWPTIPLSRWRCTANMARMHGLPGGLAKLSTVFKLGVEAKSEGQKYIQLFCVPRKSDGGFNGPDTHPIEWAEFLAYAGQDVTAMRAFWKKCPHWNATPRMWALWHMDQRINARGVAFDLDLARAAVTHTTRAKLKLAERTEELTNGDVQRTTQRDRLLAYLADYGVDLPDLTGDTVERRLNDDDLPPHIKELLRIRQQASKTSTTKYKRILASEMDGRLFDLLVFCGAARTGRFAGRIFQPQNLPRPTHKQWEIDLAIKAFKNDSIDLYNPDDVVGLGSSCLRGSIIAGRGKKLIVLDYRQIESRGTAWLAGEQWKLDAFALYDQGKGADNYKVAYASAFDIDPHDIEDKGDLRRQIGKVMELALQYYGGVGAFCSMVETYHIDLQLMANSAWPILTPALKEEAREAWSKAARRRYGLDEKVWIVCWCLVQLWRRRHPKIVSFWYAVDRAVKKALRSPNQEFKAGRLVIDRRGNWLRVRLPSGRYLLYPAPRSSEYGGESFMGVSPYTHQWTRISTYSGKVVQNATEGICADLLMEALQGAELYGYEPILSVHDEGLHETPDSKRYSIAELSEIYTAERSWAQGLPLAVEGFEGYRYRK